MSIDSSLIEDYLEYYTETQGILPERLVSFGETYRSQGYLTQDQLYEIAYASSQRSAYHVRKNPDERCRQVTKNITVLDDAFSQIGLLTTLTGFKAPTASCVLAAYDPNQHAVVDTRVWATLERFDYVEDRKEQFDAADYVTMIDAIRTIAGETGFSPTEVGYALFAYDAKHRDGTLH